MIKISKKNIIILGLLVAGCGLAALAPLLRLNLNSLVASAVSIFGHKDPEFVVDGRTIRLKYTDDTDKESLIIKSDQARYSGFGGSDVYFSVTNTTDTDESAIALFYFPGLFIPNRVDPPGVKPATVSSLEQLEGSSWKKLDFFDKNIKINEELLGESIHKRKSIPDDFEVKAGTQISIPAGQTAYFRSKIVFPPGSEGEFWIETLGKNGGYGLLDPWYSSSWAHRRTINIDYTKVSGGSNLTNFPVLVSTTDLELRTIAFGGRAASGSGEFVFTSSDGTTVLPHDIEKYTSSSGEFIGWVNVTTVSATADTTLYMYYGGPAAGGATNQNKSGTWNSNYKGVWHLNETVTDESTTTGAHRDSTSNANHGTQKNNDDTTGKIGTGQSFDGTADSINFGSASSVDDQHPYTLELWAKSPAGFGGGLFLKRTSGQTGFWRWVSTSTGALLWFKATSATNVLKNTNTGLFTVGVWNHFALTWDGTTAHSGVHVYINGVEASYAGTATDGTDILSDAGSDLTLGARADGTTDPFNGQQDEARFSTTARSAGWITTSYNNQSSPSTFLKWGISAANIKYGSNVSTDTVANWYTSGANTWAYRKKITIDKFKVSGGSDLSNFPALITLTDSNLKTTANGGKAASGSGEFVFTSSNGTTALDHEIETYSATTGEFIGWVEIPTLSATQDTSIYIYYGGPAAGGATNQNPAGTWNSNFVGVWHLGNGTTLNAGDSKNTNNGTNNSVTAISGKIDGAGSFNGTSSYVNLGNSSSLTPTSEITLSAWVTHPSPTSAGRKAIIDTDANGNVSHFLIIPNTSTGKIRFRAITTSKDATVALKTNTWQHIVGTYDGSNQSLYIDGKLDISGALTGSLTANGTDTNIGRAPANRDYWTDNIDEVRIYSDGLSAGWIATEYNNQNSPGTFYTLGGQEARTPTNPGLKIRGGVIFR